MIFIRFILDCLGKRVCNDWFWILKFCIEFGIECFKKSFNLILVLILKKLFIFKVIGKYFFILILYMF